MIENVNRKYFRLSVGKLKKDSPDEMSCDCPVCGDTQKRLHLYHTEVGDLVHCFNADCTLEQSHHSMKNFLEIVGSPHLGSYKRETMMKTVETLKNEESLQSILDKVNTKNSKDVPLKHHNQPEIPLDTLFLKAKDVPEAVKYLAQRGIGTRDNWYFSKDKFFEHNNKKVFLENYLIVPIINKDGKYRGFYSRSINEKRFSMFLLPDTEKIWIKDPTKKVDIICEGIFDAISTRMDNPAAMLGAGLSKHYRETLPKDTIFAFDSDETGMKRALEYAGYGFRIFVWPEDVIEKDFNEMLVNKKDVKEMVKNNIFQGIDAVVRLKMRHR